MNDLDAIVAAHSDAVWRAAYRLLDHRDDALECFQETFLAAAKLSNRDEVRHWRALLLRIVTCKAVDRLRDRYRRDEAPSGHDHLATVAAAGDAPDAAFQSAELREQVRRALSRLPQQQAAAFWLRHIEQLSVDEVAEQMQIKPAHVRVLIHRATTSLRRMLGSTYGSTQISENSP